MAIKHTLMKLASTGHAVTIAQLVQLMLLQNAKDSPFEFQVPHPIVKNWKLGTNHLQHLNLDATWGRCRCSRYTNPIYVIILV